jgi:DNA methylase
MPQRQVHHADALEWLAAPRALGGASVITSLPDVSELRLDLAGWQRWFLDAAGAVLRALDDSGVAIFYQSDIRKGGVWIDKGALVARAAETAGAHLLFHKIVCRLPPGTPTAGRASYAHLVGYARRPRPLRRPSPDVIPDGGFRPAPKAMGVIACEEACHIVLHETPTRTVVDPFCGFGTVLAVANSLGLDAVGVDVSARMCRRAKTLEIAA